MGHELLRGDALQRCQRLPFSYAEVAATRGPLPAGYQHLRERGVLGTGPEVFERAAAAVLRWEVQRRAGIRVTPSAPDVATGVVAVLRIGVGPLAVRAPIRVAYVVDEPDRRGFAYGTLPVHPESGEEAFVVERDASGSVYLTVTAFSRPATRLARLGRPVTSLVQRWVTRRYLRALREPGTR